MMYGKKSTPPSLPDELKKIIVWTINKDGRGISSVLIFSTNGCYCYALWGRGHNEIETIGKA